MASLRAEFRRLGTSGIVYLIPNLLLRGLTVLLTPVYARVMPPSEYGTLGVATTIGSVASIALSLSLHGSISRLHFECADEREERTFYASLLAFTLIVPTLLAACLHLAGTRGVLDVFATVRFEPHLRIVLWTAWAQAFVNLPTALYMVREQPGRVALLNAFVALSQLGLTLLYVVVFGYGLLGALRAALHAAMLSALVSVIVLAMNASLSFSTAHVSKALAFSVPLVPHGIAAWALSISDRVVLERFVPKDDLGRYSLGYLFAFAVGLFAQSVTTPLVPAANRQLKDDRLKQNVPPLGTFTLLAIFVGGLLAAAFAREAIHLMSPPAYWGAERFVVPFVVLGAVFQGVYFVWSTGTWFSMKTRLVPAVTAAGALVNVTMNLVFVPRYGITAAAAATAAAYGVMALLHGWLARRLYPIPWEYRRWASMFVVVVVAYLFTRLAPEGALGTAAKAVVVIGAAAVAALVADVRRLGRS